MKHSAVEIKAIEGVLPKSSLHAETMLDRLSAADSRKIASNLANSDNAPMTEPLNRPELDAKLATIEAKMDGRLARIEDRFSSIDRQFSDMRSILAEQKNTAWKAAGTTIGVFVAVFAIYVASFDSGRETAKMAADAKQEVTATLNEMRQIVRDLKSPQPALPSPTPGPSSTVQPAK